jgi:hypothetical protein
MAKCAAAAKGPLKEALVLGTLSSAESRPLHAPTIARVLTGAYPILRRDWPQLSVEELLAS